MISECEEEKNRAEVREKEMSALRSEIFTLKQKANLGPKGMSENGGILQTSVLEGEKHIYKGNGAWNIEKDELAMVEKLQAENKRELEMKEMAIKVHLEDEISSLKSQIKSLQQQLVPGAQDVHNLVTQDADKEVTPLQERGSDRETEIYCLTELPTKKKNKADCESKQAEDGREKANGECWAENVLSGYKREINVEESSMRVMLEIEISSLKSQVKLLQQHAVSGAQDLNRISRAEDAQKEIILLKSHISERDIKISQLKESLRQENMRLYSEMTKNDEEMKKADAEICSAGKMDADKEAEEKQKELAIRLGLEAEISALKSRIVLLQQENGLRNEKKVSEEQTDINQLKKLLEKERNRADSEVKAKEGMQKALEAQKIVKNKNIRADEERRLADIERKRFEEATLELVRLRDEVQVLRSNKISETLMFKETNKKHEIEKQKVIEEKQCADYEITKAAKRSRLLDMTKRHIVEEDRHSLGKLEDKIAEHASFMKNVKALGDNSVKNTEFRAGKLKSLPQIEVINRESEVSKFVMDCVQCRGFSNKLREIKQKAKRGKKLAAFEMAKAEELRKVVESYGEKVMVDKRQVEELAHELEDNRCKTDELKKAIHELMSSGTLVNTLVNNSTNTDTTRIKLLKKELKIGKMQVKHAKEVASLEKGRNFLLQQEIWRIKKECSRISDHFDSLDKCFSSKDVGIDDLKKVSHTFYLSPPPPLSSSDTRLFTVLYWVFSSIIGYLYRIYIDETYIIFFNGRYPLFIFCLLQKPFFFGLSL